MEFVHTFIYRPLLSLWVRFFRSALASYRRQSSVWLVAFICAHTIIAEPIFNWFPLSSANSAAKHYRENDLLPNQLTMNIRMNRHETKTRISTKKLKPKRIPVVSNFAIQYFSLPVRVFFSIICCGVEKDFDFNRKRKIKELDTTHTHHNDCWDYLFDDESTVFRFSLSREATSLCWDDEKSFCATHPNSQRWTREIYIVRVRAFHTEKTASSTTIFIFLSLSLARLSLSLCVLCGAFQLPTLSRRTHTDARTRGPRARIQLTVRRCRCTLSMPAPLFVPVLARRHGVRA